MKRSVTLPDHNDCSLLDLPYIKRLWVKTQLSKQRTPHIEQAIEQEWGLSVQLFDLLNLGLEPALTMLYKSTQIEAFTDFILEKNQGQISAQQKQDIVQCVQAYLTKNSSKSYSKNQHTAEQTNTIQQTQIETKHSIPQALTQEQLSFWEENGYLVIPNVVSQEECQQLRNEIYNHIGVDPHAPDTWYHPQAALQKIMVQLFNSPTQLAIRNNQTIHDIFKQLWQNNNLIVSTDRVSFNPPETKQWLFPGPSLHLDVALKEPIPFGTQGMVYLTDTLEKQGAFCCVPKFHHQFDQWLQTMDENQNPQDQDWSQFEIKPIAAKAGSLIIWHHALPHGSSPNNETQPRVVQYINMHPAT